MNKSIYIVLYPYKFTEHIYNYLELDVFKKFSKVEVWDLSPLLTAKFSNSYSAERFESNEICQIKNFSEFIIKLRRLNSQIGNAKICIYNAIPNQSFKDLICNFLIYVYLKKPSLSILKAYFGGIPTHFNIGNESSLIEKGYFSRIKRLLKTSTSFQEIKRRISSLFFSNFARLLPSTATHLLIAGEHYLEEAISDKTVNKTAQKVFLHCQDYSNSLLKRNISQMGNLSEVKYAVLLDAPGPMFTSDYTILKRKVFLTTEVWYPTLTAFFDKLELDTGVKIKIAGHYKAKHPFIAPCFGNREVYYHKTSDLVKNCEYVITRSSAATSYAVMFNKPVLFIYSDELQGDDLAMHDIYGMAHLLGTNPININQYPDSFNQFLKVNEQHYHYYKMACLTSTLSQRPNVQTILEDIMHIDTKGVFEL
ncbi:hypothetical protein [Aquirufa aurantiipilula]|uniref:hypothetical protein n=1 Tax=Aquirufa aurantiipilula TaxID=2696561 RepID=UPI001CAA575B|nr:hypothetical protein [Aquirufa aurantiipilula]MBZ1326586.1 hypothetical protein [Aquirufa aurantiipilula]